MSEAYQCERCGELFEGRSDYALLHGEHEGRYLFEGREYDDLCDDCYGKLEKFMGGRELKYSVLDAMSGVNLEYDSGNATNQLSTVGTNTAKISFPVVGEKYPETDLKRQIELGGRNY